MFAWISTSGVVPELAHWWTQPARSKCGIPADLGSDLPSAMNVPLPAAMKYSTSPER
jgi:hypothetical protein